MQDSEARSGRSYREQRRKQTPCSATECDAGGSQTWVMPASAMSSTLPIRNLYHPPLCFQDSQLKPWCNATTHTHKSFTARPLLRSRQSVRYKTNHRDIVVCSTMLVFTWCRRRCYLKQDLSECQIGGQSKKHEEKAHAQACARQVYPVVLFTSSACTAWN